MKQERKNRVFSPCYASPRRGSPAGFEQSSDFELRRQLDGSLCRSVVLLLLILFVCCSSPNQTEVITTVDIEKAFIRSETILLSDFSTNEIEYIPLETKKESLIADQLSVFATDKYIVTITLVKILLFDRQTGKFIREIARGGPNQNEYVSGALTLIDEKKLTIRCPHLKGGIDYGFDGKVVRKITFPENDKRGSIIPLADNHFAKYIEAFPGVPESDPCRLYIFDSEGNVINEFLNFNSFESNLDLSAGFSGGTGFNIYEWKNDVFFYENCIDTLYKLSSKDMIPYIHFQLGKYNPPYSKIPIIFLPPEKPLILRYFMFLHIAESDRFLFFSFFHDKKDRGRQMGQLLPISRYFGFYDKKTGVTKISEVDHTDRSPAINDIDHFSPVYPFSFSINQSGEFVSYMEAEEILAWIEDNPEKVKELSPQLQALSKLKFDDNQVVVIFKLKQ